MKKLSLTLSRNILLTIYKTFVRPILDYAGITSDKPLTEFFKDKSKMDQCIMQLLLLLVQPKVHRVIIFTESSV